MGTTATIVVDFSNAAGGAYLSAELDDDKNGGVSSFNTDSTVYFKVYSDTSYTISVSSGTVIAGNTNIPENIEGELLTFAGTDTTSTSKKLLQVVKEDWCGESTYSPITPTENTPTECKCIVGSSAVETLAACVFIDYTSEYDSHSLTPPPAISDNYAIVILISVE